MTKLQQYLTSMRNNQELMVSKLTSSQTLLYFIIIILVGEIFYLVNELNQFREDNTKLGIITDNLRHEVEKLKQADISLTEKDPSSSIPWKKIGVAVVVVSSAVAAVFFLLYLGNNGIDPKTALEFTDSLGRVARSDTAGVINTVGTTAKVQMEGITGSFQILSEHLKTIDLKIAQVMHQITL